MEFKKYLRGVGDAGTRLLFKFRSGTHGLNEELGRHRGREGRKECLLCDAECESVSHHCTKSYMSTYGIGQEHVVGISLVYHESALCDSSCFHQTFHQRIEPHFQCRRGGENAVGTYELARY